MRAAKCEAAMAWTFNAADHTYQLITDSAHCLIWRTKAGLWWAFVGNDGRATMSSNCPTVDEAKAWCEAQLPRQHSL